MKNAQNLLKFGTFDFDVENDFYQRFTTFQTQIGSKIKSAQNLLKFGTFDISNINFNIKNDFL